MKNGCDTTGRSRTMQTNSSLANTFNGTVEFLALVYHSVVRDVRSGKGNAIQAILLEILQSATMVIFFYVMISFLGMRSIAVRGSFVLYVMTGVFLYLTHIKAMGAVAKGNSNSPMLNHRPVTTLLLIISGALSSLYIQILAVIVITFVANVLIDPFTVYDLKMTSFCFLLAWSTGMGVGILFLALTPFLPETMKIVSTVYKRANMIFSGKMFVANSLPSYLLPFFIWNPLFHTIDQARGAAFVNYTPRFTTLVYPIIMTCILIALGLMMEHWSRKYFSHHWNKRR